MWVVLRDEGILPRAAPSLESFLAFDGVPYVPEVFEPHKSIQMITPGKPLPNPSPMLTHSSGKIIGHSNVEGGPSFVRHHINPVVMVSHWGLLALSSPAKRSPTLSAQIRKVLLEGGQDWIHREPDHIAHRTFEAFDETTFIFLRCVGPGFVQWIDGGQIGVKIDLTAGSKFHPGGLDKSAHSPGPEMNEAHSGEDLVNPSAKRFQHRPGRRKVRRFSKGPTIECHNGIRPQHDAVAVTASHIQCLAFGIEQAHLPGGKGRIGQFFDLRRLNRKFDPGRQKQAATTR